MGVTGGMAMGKSTAAGFLRGQGIRVVDTDDLSRQLTRRGEPAHRMIVERFGGGLLDGQGEIRRDLLAARAFSDPALLLELESILHPPIRERWLAETAGWRVEGVEVGAVIIPLLFETGAETSFDAIVCLACSETTQRERLQTRGIPSDQVVRRLARQWPVAKKIAKSDYVVWTDVPEAVHRDQLAAVLSRLAG